MKIKFTFTFIVLLTLVYAHFSVRSIYSKTKEIVGIYKVITDTIITNDTVYTTKLQNQLLTENIKMDGSQFVQKMFQIFLINGTILGSVQKTKESNISATLLFRKGSIKILIVKEHETYKVDSISNIKFIKNLSIHRHQQISKTKD